jgi:TPR repeat protein
MELKFYYAAMRLGLMLVMMHTIVMAQDVSFGTLLEQARGGDYDAQNELGIAYSEGKGVRPNQEKAVYWFRKSSEQGYAIGTCNLALHYGRGRGVQRNKTLLMQYVFAAHALDGLKCHPAVYIEYFKPTECQMERGWELAVEWLRAHPAFKNNFGERPWMEPDGEYPVTLREGSPVIELPVKSKCKGKRRINK